MYYFAVVYCSINFLKIRVQSLYQLFCIHSCFYFSYS
nr:MAG TPA: hypothetical protein [Caudoviricetes sp.]